MISLKNLSFSYGNQNVFHDVSLSSSFLIDNKLVAVIGANGCGKSTLLKLMIKTLFPTGGHIQYAKKNCVTYLPQQVEYDRTFPLVVKDIIKMGLNNPPLFLKKDHILKIENVLQKVGMLAFKDKPIQFLSGGQFQRMLFARMLLENKDLLLLDEPFSAIDQDSKKTLMQLLQEMVSAGKNVLCVCHDMHLVQMYFNAVLFVKDGQVLSFSMEEWKQYQKEELDF